MYVWHLELNFNVELVLDAEFVFVAGKVDERQVGLHAPLTSRGMHIHLETPQQCCTDVFTAAATALKIQIYTHSRTNTHPAPWFSMIRLSRDGLIYVPPHPLNKNIRIPSKSPQWPRLQQHSSCSSRYSSRVVSDSAASRHASVRLSLRAPSSTLQKPRRRWAQASCWQC